MKGKVILLISLLICLVALTGCDPIYPPGEIKVENMELTQGASADIWIKYPYEGGSIVVDWKDQTAEIISGDDIVSVSGLTVTGLKPGTALLKVSATTVITDEAAEQGFEERVYSTEIEIVVK